MCLSALYLDGDSPKNLVMERVSFIEVDDDGWLSATNLFGEQCRIEGSIESVDLEDNKVFVRSKAS